MPLFLFLFGIDFLFILSGFHFHSKNYYKHFYFTSTFTSNYLFFIWKVYIKKKKLQNKRENPKNFATFLIAALGHHTPPNFHLKELEPPLLSSEKKNSGAPFFSPIPPIP